MISTPRPGSTHLPSLFLALVSGFGVFIGLAAAGILELLSLGRYSQEIELGVYAWTAGLVMLINLAALIYSLPRAMGRQALTWQVQEGWRFASIAMGLWVIDLAAASLLADRPNGLTGLLLPPLSVLAVAIPLWWLIELGRRGLRSTAQRTWGTASTTILVTVPLVVVVELTGFLVLGILILVWLAGSSPDLVTQLEQLANSLANGNVGPDALIGILQPYLQRPGVILAGLLVLSVLTPLIEEFFKPLMMWFIPGRKVSESEGFTLGLVAGGVFALLETLGSLSALTGRSDLWLVLVLVRAGTGLLHITCSGLVGWGLAAAWSRRRYLKLIGLYLLAVAIHGTWNLFAQLMALGNLLPENSLGSIAGRVAPFIMAVMAVAILMLLRRLNRHLKTLQEPLAAASIAASEMTAPVYPPVTLQPAGASLEATAPAPANPTQESKDGTQMPPPAEPGEQPPAADFNSKI